MWGPVSTLKRQAGLRGGGRRAMAGRLSKGTGKQKGTGRPSGVQTWVGGRAEETAGATEGCAFCLIISNHL